MRQYFAVHTIHEHMHHLQTWYDLTGAFNLEKLKETVDAFVDLDLKSYGYNYWNLDDLWSGGRYPNGTIYADRSKLPSGTLRPLADYVHSKGLLFGAYTDRGVRQCGPGPGSEGHEAIDAQTFADWQIDYLKEDSCRFVVMMTFQITQILLCICKSNRKYERFFYIKQKSLQRTRRLGHCVQAIWTYARRAQQNRQEDRLLTLWLA